MTDETVQNTVETGPGGLETTIGEDITVQDDVTSIPKDKNAKRNTNYYSGTIRLKCVINGFCPVFRKWVVDDCVVLNNETLKTFPEEDIKNINSVPGLPGIYLRERYNYLSNFLQINGKDAQGNYITDQTASTDNFSYTCEQTFNAVNSVFDGVNEGPIDGFSQTQPVNLGNRAAWRYVRYNHPTDSDNSDQDVLIKNPEEYKDSGIQYMAQVAASATNTKGIHWKVEKVTSLFQGEDFFITFKKAAIDTDISNIQSKHFTTGSGYDYLDVSFNEPPDVNGNAVYPRNSAVVEYKKELTQVLHDAGENETTTEEIEEYVKVPGTTKSFDLNKQAYYIVEMGPNADEDKIFILITQKAYPTAVIYAGGQTYSLGSYQTISGDTLMQSSNWTMQVRNHLGFLVVAFNGNTEKPWIIAPPGVINKIGVSGVSHIEPNGGTDVTTANRIIDKLVVPAARLSIWGGNIASAINFSPLTYADEVQLNLPPQDKNKNNDKNLVKQKKYHFPSKGTKKAYCTIADSDSINSGDLVGNTTPQSPVYSSDVQIAEGANLVGSNSTSGQSYFSLTKKYLKAAGGMGTTDDVTTQPYIPWASMIKLDAKSIYTDDNDESFSFILETTLTAGDHDFVGISGIQGGDTNPDDSSNTNVFGYTPAQITPAGCAKRYTLHSCKTPVLTQIRHVAEPDKDVDGWDTDNSFEVNDLVIRYDENYSAPDFHTMTHTGTIVFLMNRTVSSSDLVDRLEALRSTAFYIELWGAYTTCNYPLLPINKGFKLFTGICYGGTLEEKAGERTMTCHIEDYTKILKDSPIFNSPFFDGMRDVNAVYKILSMLAFKDTGDGDSLGPAYLCKLQAESNTPQFSSTTPDGRGSFSTTYVLSDSYARLTSPYFKFQDGTMTWNALEQIAKKAGKVIFFDAYGLFHFECLSFDRYLYNNGSIDDVPVLWYYTTSPFGFGQLILEVITREKSVTDVYNIIHLMTATPERELAIWDDVNWDSLYQTNSPGFLGYKKVYYQQDGIFGSVNTLDKLGKFYKSKFNKPPIIYKFQSYGVPMRCFDIVSVNGQKLIVTSISNNFDPRKNMWSQSVEGEWYGTDENFSDK